ncbi:hormogonium polysaccharide biosynthesis protein HpsJ [Leptolyngbya sp. AN02str]|uniref:hormogonium polysaccharide biosynthesis protein HpsJ n=1 Tax=Leptolyngbya sp. AN02str TaxID=3423363 RepID=UPI003D31D9D6
MISSKPTSNPTAAFLASRVMMVAGIIIFLAALLDMIILPIPYQWGERAWQLAFTTQIVDRGLVPLVGLGLLFAGYWVETFLEPTRNERPRYATIRFWAAVIASILGLTYLLLFPFHLNNVRASNQAVQERVTQEAEQAQTQLDQQLNAEVERQRAQIEQLIAAPDDQLDEAIAANLITQEQANLVRDFRENPDSLEPFLQERAQQSRAQAETQIQTRQEQAREEAATESLKSGLRIGLTSLLLAIGYIIIGWTALRLVGQP